MLLWHGACITMYVRKNTAAKTMHPDLCAICGRERFEGESWFLATQGKWKDRIDIWKYETSLVHSELSCVLCGPKHLRELVVHWMTTGCLQYPFASSGAPIKPKASLPRRIGAIVLPSLLCEVSVDREAIVRAQRDNPLALNTILDEMMLALEPEPCEPAPEEFDSDEYFTIPELE